ncbi:MAG: hypothetical protein ACLFU9_01850 [Candidatus Bathyarchaeia archaeon]
MLEKKDKNKDLEDVEELKLVLSTVSTEIPALIKNIIASVFSEEAGRSMGKAAAAFYKELKDSGIPNEVALKMTEDYMSTFTSLGNIVKQIGKGKQLTSEKEKELENTIRQRIEEKMAEKMREKGLKLEDEEED